MDEAWETDALAVGSGSPNGYRHRMLSAIAIDSLFASTLQRLHAFHRFPLLLASPNDFGSTDAMSSCIPVPAYLYYPATFRLHKFERQEAGQTTTESEVYERNLVVFVFFGIYRGPSSS